MVLDMAWDRDMSYLFTSSVDCEARSWMPEIGDEVRSFKGATRSITFICVKGNIRQYLI